MNTITADDYAHLPPLENQHAQDWVDALRSGQYVQGRGVMKNVEDSREPRYCCLGVACELAQLSLIPSPGFKRSQLGWERDGWPVHSHLPDWLREAVDLLSSEVAYLVYLNDQCNADFHAIADYIEYAVRHHEDDRRHGRRVQSMKSI